MIKNSSWSFLYFRHLCEETDDRDTWMKGLNQDFQNISGNKISVFISIKAVPSVMERLAGPGKRMRQRTSWISFRRSAITSRPLMPALALSSRPSGCRGKVSLNVHQQWWRKARKQRLSAVKWNKIYKQCLAVVKESARAVTHSEKRRNDFHVYVIENLYSWEGI